MPRRRIHADLMNIDAAIVREAELRGLDATATGGGLDYIYKELGKNEDGSSRIVILSSASDAGSPDSLSDGADLVIMLNESWIEQVAISVRSAKEGMALMEKMFNPYARDLVGGSEEKREGNPVENPVFSKTIQMIEAGESPLPWLLVQSRGDLIHALEWNDRNGVYSDKDTAQEGLPPTTVTTAAYMILHQTLEGAVSEEVARAWRAKGYSKQGED